MLDHRPASEPSKAITPWGKADQVQRYPQGIRSYATPSHGGFCVPFTLAQYMPGYLMRIGEQTGTGWWYEEDCAWCAVPTVFPQCFTVEQIGYATQTLKDWYPNQFEQHYEIELKPGDSMVRDEETWTKAHAQDWVVRSALRAKNHAGYCLCVARKDGGEHVTILEERHYLIPTVRYDTRKGGGHVIDTKAGDIEVTKQWFDEAWRACYAK